MAIIGSRNLHISNLCEYLPKDTSEIVSGGAKGVDSDAGEFAKAHNIPFREFLPEYSRYKRGAPFRRNVQICEYADKVLAFWDGKSKGTKYVIDYCEKHNIAVSVIIVDTTQ